MSNKEQVLGKELGVLANKWQIQTTEIEYFTIKLKTQAAVLAKELDILV